MVQPLRLLTVGLLITGLTGCVTGSFEKINVEGEPTLVELPTANDHERAAGELIRQGRLIESARATIVLPNLIPQSTVTVALHATSGQVALVAEAYYADFDERSETLACDNQAPNPSTDTTCSLTIPLEAASLRFLATAITGPLTFSLRVTFAPIENAEISCNDGLDNDLDGYSDQEDLGCSRAPCPSGGCGRACEPCGSGQVCNPQRNVCECAPSCDGKSCGDDGCGGSCGICEGGCDTLRGLCGRAALAIAAGPSHTCAVLDDGAAMCWGRNIWGQLGTGRPDDEATPVAAQNLSTAVTEITTGGGGIFGDHSCALVGGGVACFGNNVVGQLGIADQSGRVTVPQGVAGLSDNLQSVAAGNGFTCVLATEGTVKCFGSDDAGQLGDGDTRRSQNTPVSVTGLRDVTAISAGGAHVCARTASGGAACWGANTLGQLGNGSAAPYSGVPVSVAGLPAPIGSLGLGTAHSCAQLENGAVYCWGGNDSGQLGSGPSQVQQKNPTLVATLNADAVRVAAGGAHSCALLQSGAVMCWGNNAYGQLGDGSKTHTFTPVRVRSLPGAAISVSCGMNHTCAVIQDGSLFCWGDNQHGQLGTAAGGGVHAPKKIE